MAVEGYIGLPRQGKTLAAMEEGLNALAEGHELYANFLLGVRVRGWLVPECSAGGGEWCSAGWRSASPHLLPSYVARDPLHHLNVAVVRAASEVRPADRRLYDAVFRRGRGFVPDAGLLRLTGWQQIVAIQQGHDAFGVRHRMALQGTGRYDEDGEEVCVSVPVCRSWDCGGCSKGVTVIVDEVNQWAPSRYWQKIGMAVLIRWANSGKDGLRIVWTAQSLNRVDKVLREVTDFVWTCRAYGGVISSPFGKFHGQIFTRRKYYPVEVTDKNMVIEGEGAQRAGGAVRGYRRYWWVGAMGRLHDVADHYDTLEHVALAAHLRSVGARESVVVALPRPAVVAGRGRGGDAA